MGKVIYTGTSDAHILGADDLDKAGVEGFKSTTFAKGIAVEVSDEAADAIINDPIFGGEFRAPKKKAKAKASAVFGGSNEDSEDDESDDEEELSETPADTSSKSTSVGNGTTTQESSATPPAMKSSTSK